MKKWAQATEAMAFIESAERRVLAEHNPGIREFEIDLLDRLRYRIEAGIAPAPVAAASPAPAAIASFGMV